MHGPDEAALKDLAREFHDQKNYILKVIEKIAMQEQLLQKDKQENPTTGDHAWDSEHMREVIARQ